MEISAGRQVPPLQCAAAVVARGRKTSSASRLLTVVLSCSKSGQLAKAEERYPAMLTTIPLDEIVTLTLTYELHLERGVRVVRSPLSRKMSLRAAVGQALSCRGQGARASITARGFTY